MHSISVEQHYSLTPIAKAAEWHQQRDVSNPNSEAETGVDFPVDEGVEHIGTNDSPHDEDDVSVEDFMKACDPGDEAHDQMSKDLHLCAQHMARTKLHQMCGDHEESIKSHNRAMTHFQRFHSALKGATEDN